MGEPDIRVGIIGAGANTRLRHIPGLQAIEGVEIAGVCNRSGASSQAVADEFGIPGIYDDWREAVDDPDTNAVVIGAWPNLHCRATVAALEAGKHVLCEARMARDAAEARRMLRAAEARPDLVAQLVPSPFTLAVDSTISRLLAEGFVGRLLAIRVEDGGGFPDPEAPFGWRMDADLSGHNALSLGIWYEALMRWVGEATRVMAGGRVFEPTRLDDDGSMRTVRVPDHVDVIADMACGAQAQMRFSSVTGHTARPGVDLCGSKGVLTLLDGRLFGARRDDPETEEIAIQAEERERWRVEEEFAGAIRREERVARTTFEDGVKYMEFTEAVARSMAEGRAVGLPLV